MTPLTAFEGTLRLPRQYGQDLVANVALADGRLRLESGDTELGEWPLNDLKVGQQVDGIHLEIDQEEIVLVLTEPDAFIDSVEALKAPPERRGWRRNGQKANESPPRRSISPEPPTAVAVATTSSADLESAPPETTEPRTEEIPETPKPMGPSTSELRKAARRARRLSMRRSVGSATKGTLGGAVTLVRKTPKAWKIGAATLLGTAALGLWDLRILAAAFILSGAASLVIGTAAVVDPVTATKLPVRIPRLAIITGPFLIVAGLVLNSLS